MAHRRGSFHDNVGELLESFAHRGTPAALEDQLRDLKPKTEPPAQCRSYQLNQGLFERSQG